MASWDDVDSSDADADTALAAHLRQEGLLDPESLRSCFRELRQRTDVDLAALLLERGLVEPRLVYAALSRLGLTGEETVKDGQVIPIARGEEDTVKDGQVLPLPSAPLNTAEDMISTVRDRKAPVLGPADTERGAPPTGRHTAAAPSGRHAAVPQPSGRHGAVSARHRSRRRSRADDPLVISDPVSDDPLMRTAEGAGDAALRTDAGEGDMIGPYRILRELARGGMGAVYEVEHEATRIHYAIKQILPAGVGVEAVVDRKRFRHEAEALARLRHPNIVRIHSAHLEGRRPYLVQDLLIGGSLSQRLEANGAFAVPEVVSIGAKLARALEHAHERGILHRDVKPQNVLFDDRGEPRLVDFGLARNLSQSSLTATGQVLGTPVYMAPEQAKGSKITDARTDVYGLGIVLYTLLAGRPPWRGRMHVVLQHVIHDEPPDLALTRTDLPPRLLATVSRAVSKRPEDRFRTAAELAEALERTFESERAQSRLTRAFRQQVRRRRRLLGGLLAILGAVLVVGGVAAWTRHEIATPQPSSSASPTPSAVAQEEDAAPPAWFLALAPDARPSLPLPAGLGWGEAAGEYVARRDGSVLVYLPPGEFEMGSDRAARSSGGGGRITRVRFSGGRFIGKLEVSWAQYRRFCQETGNEPPDDRVEIGEGFTFPADHPVTRISRDEAAAYCAWAGLRLPSEPEWEYAARGTDARIYPWGNDPPSGERLNLADAGTPFDWREMDWRDPWPFTSPVDSLPASASPFGCLNMAGNVAEWVADAWYDKHLPGPLDDPPPRRPEATAQGTTYWTYKGGSWKSPRRLCHAFSRGTWTPGETVGFRVARDATD